MKLIDADALINTIAIIAEKFAKSDAQKALMGRIIYHLERKPEQVVRCKDCVWWEACGHLGTVGKCESPHNGLWNEYTYAGDYCSYGERKEE